MQRIRRVRRRRDLGKSFHGVTDKRRKVKIRVPRKGETLIRLGRLDAIVYQPEGRSQRRGKTYEHRFGDKGKGVRGRNRPILAVTADGKQLWIINGRSRYRVTGRGIVG